jgi:uroporphyrinogen III methyltransferase/synthase
VDKANENLMVVRLKGGDPFVFARCAEEMSVLDQAGIKYEIVPGVTAALACAAYAGVPLSHREFGSSISFLTGHEDLKKESLRVDFAKFAEVGGTLCIYMGMSKLEEIVDRLLQGGLSPEKPTIVVSNGTLPTQRKIMCSLGELVAKTREEGLAAPAVIFIGNAIGLATKANWFEDRPLFGRRFVVTRSTAQNGEMRNKLQNLGADVLELPLIRILPTEDKKLVAEVFAGIATYEWGVFTSANGAREFLRIFFKAFKDIRSFGPMRIACVGEATASIFRKHNLEVELVPETATAENLAKALVATDSLDSANVLVVSGNRNREVMVNMLETMGHAIVDILPVYGTDFADVVNSPDLERYKKGGADGIIFSSSSTALSFVEQEEDLMLESEARVPIHCSFGPETSKTLLENGLTVELECTNPSIDDMLGELVQYFS